MRKLWLFIILIFTVGTGLARGEIVLINVNHCHLVTDLIRFKLVIKDGVGQIVKELYTPVLLPEEEITIMPKELGIQQGVIDYYLENVSHQSGFKECIPDWPYHTSYFTRIGGWHDGQDHMCHLMEDG